MHLPQMGLMFDDRPSVFGLPGDFVVFCVAVVGFVIGFLWLRHVLPDDPEVRSFRATDHPAGPRLAVVAGAVGIGLVLVPVALLMVRALLR